MSEPVNEPAAIAEEVSFPPFGEDLYDAEGNLIVTWDFVNNLRLEYDSNGTVVDSQPFTEEELAMAPAKQAGNQAISNREELLSKAAAALAANSSFLDIASPTNAQAVTQIKALTRQVNALIRLQLNDLNDISGT